MTRGDKGELFIVFIPYFLSPYSARLCAPCAHTKNSLKWTKFKKKFATGSNCCKFSEKVLYFLLMRHLQKPYANFCKT